MTLYELPCKKKNPKKVACVNREDSDEPGQQHSLISLGGPLGDPMGAYIPIEYSETDQTR